MKLKILSCVWVCNVFKCFNALSMILPTLLLANVQVVFPCWWVICIFSVGSILECSNGHGQSGSECHHGKRHFVGQFLDTPIAIHKALHIEWSFCVSWASSANRVRRARRVSRGSRLNSRHGWWTAPGRILITIDYKATARGLLAYISEIIGLIFVVQSCEIWNLISTERKLTFVCYLIVTLDPGQFVFEKPVVIRLKSS